MDDSLGGDVTYTYDARDELTNETLSGTDISAIAVANTYDNAGNMTGQKRYSNTAETDVVATTVYTYDDAEQMTGITDKNSGGTTLGFVRLHLRRGRPRELRRRGAGLPGPTPTRSITRIRITTSSPA